MDVPRPILVDTGDQGEVQDTIDRFFADTMKLVLEALGNVPDMFKIRSSELAYDNGPVTNDRITILNYNGRFLASVTENRTLYNRIEYNFHRRDLNGIKEEFS